MRPKAYLHRKGEKRSKNALLATSLITLAFLGASANAAEVTYRYYRFNPTASANTQIQLSEITFSLRGQKLNLNGTTGVGTSLPVTVTGGAAAPDSAEGVQKLVDGLTNTKWFNGTYAPVTFEFAAPVTIDAYNFATANDFADRIPTAWTFQGSTDGTTWVDLDTRTGYGAIFGRSEFTYQGGFDVLAPGLPVITSITQPLPVITAAGSPVTLALVTANATTVTASPGGATGSATSITIPSPQNGTYTITASNASGVATKTINLRVVTADTLSYRYMRFLPKKLRSAGANSIQLSEFELYNGNTKLAVTSVTNPGGNNSGDGAPANVLDGNTNTKWLDFNKQGLVFDLGSTQTITSYQFSTANDADARDPLQWTMEGSADGTNWTLVESVDFDYPTPLDRYTAAGKLPFSYRAPAAPLTWAGTVSANWNKTVANFTGAQTVFTDGSSVLFDDTATAKNVSVTELIKPGVIKMTNNDPYSFAGSIINGAASLDKSGTGATTLTTPTSFTGPISISQGSIVSSVHRGLGESEAGGAIRIRGGTLDIAETQHTQRGLDVTSGTINVADTKVLRHAGPLILTDVLTKTGTGTLSLYGLDSGSAALTTTNRLQVNAGAVEFGTSYFNKTIFGGGNYRLFATVETGAVLRGTASDAFGGDYTEYAVAIRQFRANGGTIESTSGRQYLPIGLVTTNSVAQGRIVLKGGTYSGSGTLEPSRNKTNSTMEADATNASRTVISTEASDAPSMMSGSGPITLNTGHMVFDVANGEAIEDLIISKPINGNYGIIKEGAGALAIYNNNTYTGWAKDPSAALKVYDLPHGTTVRAGTLIVSNLYNVDADSATGPAPVRIMAGATLSGPGSITGRIDVQGTIDPGDLAVLDNPIATLTTNDVVITGKYHCDIRGEASEEFFRETGADMIDARGATNTTPVGTPGTLTLTGATLEFAQVEEGAVSPTYVIAKYNTRVGSFATVTGLPSGYTLVYDDTLGEIRITTDGVTPPTGYAAWIAAANLSGNDALATADPDADGLSNLIEYIVGGDPKVPSRANAPTMSRDGSGNFIFVFRRTADSASLNPGVEYSTSLTGTWTAAGAGTTNVETNGFGTGVDRVTVTLPASLSVGGKLFARLKAVY